MSGTMSEIKARLDAVKQTRQITNAMYLLSASLTKKAMQNIDFNLRYMNKLRLTMKDILSKTNYSEIENRYITEQTDGVTLFVVISADKRLCGSYNTDVIDLATKEMKKHESVVLASLGSVGNEMFRAKGIEPDYFWSDVMHHPTLYFASSIEKMILSLYNKHKVKEAYVVYTNYVSGSVRKPVCQRLLPLLTADFLDLEDEYKYTATPIYEPSAEAAFDSIVPQYVTGFMYDVFMQSVSSENAARMEAMQNATDNADEMIKELSTEINAVRQLNITNEIIEISAGSDIVGSV